MNKQKKLSIYQDIKKELLGMRPGEMMALFAPNGEENTIAYFGYSEKTGIGGYSVNDYPITKLPKIVAHLTRDVLKYWEQNPEEAKASGLL